MATVDLRGQRDKARTLAMDNDISLGDLVRVGNKSGLADDPGDGGDRATQGLGHYDTGLTDQHGHLLDGAPVRGRPGARSRTRAGRTKYEDAGINLARPGTLDDDRRYANTGMAYDIRRDGRDA